MLSNNFDDRSSLEASQRVTGRSRTWRFVSQPTAID